MTITLCDNTKGGGFAAMSHKRIVIPTDPIFGGYAPCDVLNEHTANKTLTKMRSAVITVYIVFVMGVSTSRCDTYLTQAETRDLKKATPNLFLRRGK